MNAPFSPIGSPDRIEVSCLSKVYGEGPGAFEALRDVNLTVTQGEFVCIVGPSGCGKSTLLRVLAGLEEPSSGSVRFTIDAKGRPLQSMVFQEHGVFPWMTVLENAAYGLAVRKVPRPERIERARFFLNKLGLSAFEGAYPRQLSGGMRQRVNIARAFANDPAVLLMDEPLASLDEQTKMLVQEDLVELWEGSGKTVLFVTHSLDEAVALSDRVVVMSARPGRLKVIVPVELPRPRNVIEIRNDPSFIAVRKEIWHALRDEVLAMRRSA